MRKFWAHTGKWAKKQGDRVGLLAAGVIIGTAGSAVVMANIPNSSGVIQGCYRNSGGQAGSLRVIDAEAGATCASNETALPWNQTGPQGPPGSSGGGGILLDDLVDADMTGAVMVGWNLSNKDFSGARFRDAYIGNSDLTGASLIGAKFESATLRGLNLAGFDLQNVLFDHTITPDSSLQNANLTGATFINSAGARGSTDPAAEASGANLTNVLVKGGLGLFDFTGANFTNVTFDRSPILEEETGDIFGVNFTNANFTGVEFTVNPGYDTIMINSNFTGVDLTGVTNINTVLWQNTICPDGTNSNSHGNTCVGHLAP